jgi:hypothetical protein
MKNIVALMICIALSGCGGGGGGASGGGGTAGGGGPGDGGQPQTNLLVSNNNYTADTGAATMLDFSMPNDGVLDLSLQGTKASIYDTSLALLNETSDYTTDAQIPLAAGTYKIKFHFWSANSRHAAAYSPSLLNPLNLPILENKTYSTSTGRSDYFILRMPVDGNIEFSGAGTGVSIYDLAMTKKNNTVENTGPVALPAGDYIVKFYFWSANSKSMTVFSPALAPGQPQTNLVVNNNYAGSTGSATILDFTMPIDGVIDLSLQGTKASIYDPSLTLLHETSDYTTDAQFPLAAGTYKLKFYFWSANSRHGVAYSPSLLNPLNLPLLENKTYSTLTGRSDYFILRMPADGNIEFSGAGTSVSIYDLAMAKKNNAVENTGPITLLAGDYIVKFFFWSANSKSMTVYSPILN